MLILLLSTNMSELPSLSEDDWPSDDAGFGLSAVFYSVNSLFLLALQASLSLFPR